MPDSAHGFKFIYSHQSSLLKQIRENLESVWKLPFVPLPAGQVPIHLLDLGREKPIRRRSSALRVCAS